MKFLGSPFISIITALIFLYFIIKYWILLSSLPRHYRYLLFSLRTFLILWLLLLLINPWVDWRKNEHKPQNISVIFDLSESMFIYFQNYPLQYDEIRKKIKTWGDEHDLNMNYFRLGQRIEMLDADYMEYPDTAQSTVPARGAAARRQAH